MALLSIKRTSTRPAGNGAGYPAVKVSVPLSANFVRLGPSCRRSTVVLAAEAPEAAEAFVRPRVEKPDTTGRRKAGHRIYSFSPLGRTSEGIFEKVEERDGLLMVDAVGEDALYRAALILEEVSQLAFLKGGKHVTIQPYGLKEPLAFRVAFSPLEAPPPEPEDVHRVSSRTEISKLTGFLMQQVVREQKAMTLEMIGTKSLITAFFAITKARGYCQWSKSPVDMYCSILPSTRLQAKVPGKDGLQKLIRQYRFAVYPCASQDTTNA